VNAKLQEDDFGQVENSDYNDIFVFFYDFDDYILFSFVCDNNNKKYTFYTQI